MRFRGLAAGVIVFSMACEIVAQAASVMYEPEYNQLDASVRLTGTIDDYCEKPISIVIIPENESIEALSDSRLPSDLQMAVTDENGDFDVTIPLPANLPSGKYNAVISGSFADSGMYKEFSYVSESEAAEVLKAINSAASKEALERIFTAKNLEKLAINQDDYNRIKERLLPAIINHDSFSTVNDFCNFYNSIFAMYLINNGQVDTTLEKYRVNLGIDIESYRTLSDKQKTQLDSLLIEYNYDNVDFASVYEQCIVLAKIRSAEKWSELKTCVTEAASLIGISTGTGSDYEKISNKDNVYQAMYKKTYSSFTDIKPAFDAAVASQLAAETKSVNSISGGGNGSGGSVGYNSVPSAVDTITNAGVVTNTITDSAINRVIFSDISGHWAENAIKAMYKAGVVSGYPDGSFGPDRTITRAEFAQILSSKVSESTGTIPFSDVSSNDWYYAAIAKLYNSDIVHGDGELFRPLDNIKREDAAVMVYNLLKRERTMAYGKLSLWIRHLLMIMHRRQFQLSMKPVFWRVTITETLIRRALQQELKRLQ